MTVRPARAKGRAGLDVLARYADRMDGLVREIADSARAQTTMPVAVCAIGGYGRRTLCLHSDVDLLIVTAGAIGPPEERFVNGLLQPLWDLRLTVGQHVRELADFDQIESGNPELLLALLDLRFLAGDAPLFEQAGRAARRPSARTRATQALDGLLELTDVRHARFNRTIYQLEPDVKEAPGALRDLEAVRLLRLLRPDAFRDELASRCRSRPRTPRTSCSASARCCTRRPAATSTC